MQCDARRHRVLISSSLHKTSCVKSNIGKVEISLSVFFLPEIKAVEYFNQLMLASRKNSTENETSVVAVSADCHLEGGYDIELDHPT